jgi:hypothetical protein
MEHKMKRDEFWKNFNLGTELDIAGTFIYNGLKEFDNLETFYYEQDIFEVLYNLSVGIERLEKVVVILIEHAPELNQDIFEESLITHSHIELLSRIIKKRNIKVSSVHNKFLQILTEFYKSMRYDRYILNEAANFNKEKNAFILFLHEEIGLEYKEDMFAVTRNDDRIKKFIGRVVGKIAKTLYQLIRDESHRLNLYTYELRTYSKAAKIFLAEKYDFIDETDLIKELIIFFINTKESNGLYKFIKGIKPLDFDIALFEDYIKCCQNKLKCQEIMDQVEALYEDVSIKKDRIAMLKAIGSGCFDYDEDENEDEERD